MPLAVIVVLNSAIFTAVAISLVCSAKTSAGLHESIRESKYDAQVNSISKKISSGRTTTSKATNDPINKATCNKLITIVFSCFVVLGLTWIFGFLAINQARIVFSYIFCLLNASQGFLVLIAYVLMSKPKREMWTKKFKDLKSNIKGLRMLRSHFDSTEDKNQNKRSLKNSNVSNNTRFLNATKGASQTDSTNSNSSRSTSTNKNINSFESNNLEKKDSSKSNSSSNDGSQRTSVALIKPDSNIKTIVVKRDGKNSVISFIRPNSTSSTQTPKTDVYYATSQNDKIKQKISWYTKPELLESFSHENQAFRASLEFDQILQTPILQAKRRTPPSSDFIETNNRIITASTISFKSEEMMPKINL